MNPIPVITPTRIRDCDATSSGSCAAASMYAQLAIDTSGNVRSPALRSCLKRSQPVGSPIAYAISTLAAIEVNSIPILSAILLFAQ